MDDAFAPQAQAHGAYFEGQIARIDGGSDKQSHPLRNSRRTQTPGWLVNYGNGFTSESDQPSVPLSGGGGYGPHQAVAIDNVWAFEEAFPLALSKAVEDIGYSADEIEHYRRQLTLIFINGMCNMPQDIMHDLLDQSTVMSVSSDAETVDPTVLSSWCNRFSEFMNPPHPNALHYYSTANNKFYFRRQAMSP